MEGVPIEQGTRSPSIAIMKWVYVSDKKMEDYSFDYGMYEFVIIVIREIAKFLNQLRYLLVLRRSMINKGGIQIVAHNHFIVISPASDV